MLHREGNNAKLIVYPPYKRDGHRMFFEIGGYWKDVVKFLDQNIGVANLPDAGDSK